MNLTRRAALIGAGLALTSGCATSTLVQGSYKASPSFTVSLNRPWSDITATMLPRPKGVRLLSVDGRRLNRLYLATVEPGESMVRPADRDTPRPLFRTDMSDTEQVEFVIDCVAVEFQSPEASALRPQTFGSAPGVRFDIATRTAEGLDISGSSLVARAGDRLHVMLYLAPSEHYYGALLPSVEAAFASATL